MTIIICTSLYQFIHCFFFLISVNPDGVPGNSPLYVIVGDNITITGFININGNPLPTSTWSFGGTVLSGSRFNTGALGLLTISLVTLNDAGNYTNTLMNNIAGVNMTTDNTVTLIVTGIYY